MKCGIPVSEAVPVIPEAANVNPDPVIATVPQSDNSSVPAQETAPQVSPAPQVTPEPASKEKPKKEPKQKKIREKRKFSVLPAIIAAVVTFVILVAIALKFFSPVSSAGADITGTGDSLTQMIDQADTNLEYIDQ